MVKDPSLEDTMERIARQEQVIEYLAASGQNTALAEKRLASRRRSLDTMLQRRRARAEEQANTSSAAISGQLGTAERDEHPGSEVP